jgi:hypothetical protein
MYASRKKTLGSVLTSQELVKSVLGHLATRQERCSIRWFKGFLRRSQAPRRDGTPARGQSLGSKPGGRGMPQEPKAVWAPGATG